MEFLIEQYEHIEKKILHNLKRCNIEHRTKENSGLWLGMLIGLSAIVTLLTEGSSYSEICLIAGLTGFGLVICCISLYLRLSNERIAVRDFQAIYFLPAIVTSVLYLLIANKGLLVSVIWGISVGSLGTWGVLQLMSNLPHCFTIGEATAVMHSCILFLMSAVTNLPLRYHLPPIHDNDIATVILQVGILYVMSVCLLCKYFPILRLHRNFYLMAISLLIFVTFPSFYIILDQNPLLWIFSFIINTTTKITLFAYWAVCLVMGTIVILHQIFLNSQATTSIRKTFHVLAVFVYIPGLIYEPTLLYLSSGVILGLFLMLELMRFLRIPPFGDILNQGFAVFADEKDNLVSLTPLYLLCGLSFPLWMPTNNLPLLSLFSGILTVGIGDTAASFCGSRWGSHKWTGSTKSIEGTIACTFSQVGLICALLFLGFIESGWLFLRSLLASIQVSLIEAQTNQVDNLALPLLMYIFLTI